MRHLAISEHVLGYLDHGNSVSLANLIHLTRYFVHNPFRGKWYLLSLFNHGRLATDFNVQNTLPSLQHDFCDLWNEIVLQQRESMHPGPSYLLEKFRDIYNVLHQCSNLDCEYQLCSISSHRMDSTSNLIEVDGGRPAETARAPIITSPALHHREPIPTCH